ncbi:MAG: type I phosphomannose isomerase catalytic subunit [Phycisphaerales bacterium]
MALYPLKFEPVFKEKVWGGRRIADLSRDLPGTETTRIGESWELCDFDDARSVVANGPLAGRTLHEIIREHRDAMLGSLELDASGDFPLLVKYLDAREPLSIQVHPNPEQCRGNSAARPKSEAWYILEADPDAVIYRGIRPGVSAEELRRRVESGDAEAIIAALVAEKVKPDQLYYLPAGTLHALGAGVVVAEVQTPSDTTYRLWDWNRDTGRELHIDEALRCVDFDAAKAMRRAERRSHIAGVFTTISRVCSCEHFQIERVRMVEEYGQEIPYDRPAVWVVLRGKGAISNTPAGVDVEFDRGDVLLLPAGMNEARVDLHAETVWLDIQFPSLVPSIELA